MSGDARAVGGRSWFTKGAEGDARLEAVAGGDACDVEGGVDGGGLVRLGGGRLVEDAARAGAACASQRRHLGPHAQLRKRHPEAQHALDAQKGCSLRRATKRAQLRPTPQRPSGVTAGPAAPAIKR
jgi:hypothetical protein